MKGHDRIIGMRLGGMKPLIVWLGDYPASSINSVELEPHDHPDSADLRFLCGLVVKVELQDCERLLRWVKACERAGAERILWTHYRIQGQQPEAQIIGMGDSFHVFENQSKT